MNQPDPSGAALVLSEPETEDEMAVLTIDEVARALRVSRSTVKRLVASGDLPAMRIGSSVRIPVATFSDYLERNFQPMTGRRPPRSWANRHRQRPTPPTMETP